VASTSPLLSSSWTVTPAGATQVSTNPRAIAIGSGDVHVQGVNFTLASQMLAPPQGVHHRWGRPPLDRG
jgi:hypothetical protein